MALESPMIKNYKNSKTKTKTRSRKINILKFIFVQTLDESLIKPKLSNIVSR